MFVNTIINYNICYKCNTELVKTTEIYCKNCKPKKNQKQDVDKNPSTLYIVKYANKKTYFKGQDKKTSISDEVFHTYRFRIKKELTPPLNENTQAKFFTLYWDQFNDFDGFSSFITRSAQISCSYFVLNSFEIQQKPKYQHFIQSKQEKLPCILQPTLLSPPIPLSRPLQLLTQKSFWNELIISYFQHLHPHILFFSIHSFDPKTTSEALLSAIYFGGFQSRQDKPPELINYFREYTKQNITQIIKKVSFTNAQAIFLYSVILVLGGNLALAKVCLGHGIRMGYSLGIHLHLSTLTPIQQYNRAVLLTKMRIVATSISGLSSLSLNHATEFGEVKAGILDPKWQIPTSNCYFCFDTEDENIIYGICSDTYDKFHGECTMSVWLLSNCSDSKINSEIYRVMGKLTEKYYQSIKIFDHLLIEFPSFQSNILSHKYQLTLLYHDYTLEGYMVLKSKIKKLDSKQVSKMLDESCRLFECFLLFDQ